MHILVTGGCGYIGSHTVVELLGRGDRVTVVDNLVNSSAGVLPRIQAITSSAPEFVEMDLRDTDRLVGLCQEQRFDAVIHFAGLKAVGESVAQPVSYYDNNVWGTISLLKAMQAGGVTKLVFSSSATVYGVPDFCPIPETAPVRPINPYGHTKAQIEQILSDAAAPQDLQVSVLRYFNPIGAHPSGTIGEDPNGVPNNLVPYVAQVAVGKRSELLIFGDDYPTPDGTGVRDYIHVVDLAQGHLAALDHLPQPGSAVTVNLGTGKGNSVYQVVEAFEQASGRTVPRRVVARRSGDVAESFAEVKCSADLLGWSARLDLATACADTWRWQSGNPDGYR